jgi:hypothetical protein
MTMEFMSQEHVDAMNDLLQASQQVKDICAGLPEERVLAYLLSDGPGGGTVHWTMVFADTVRFSLQQHPSPDVTLVGDWSRTIRAAKASRAGEPADPGVALTGDPTVMTVIGPAFATAQAAATLPV